MTPTTPKNKLFVLPQQVLSFTGYPKSSVADYLSEQMKQQQQLSPSSSSSSTTSSSLNQKQQKQGRQNQREQQQNEEKIIQPILTNIPLPSPLPRHISYPSPTLFTSSAIGKITGFRITVSGRRGTRSVKQTLSCGSIGSSKGGPSKPGGGRVDFAVSSWVHKKGQSGVKVWVGYDI